MISFLFRQAQATVDNAIGQIAYGLIVALPLLAAAGFASAALSSYLHRQYDSEVAYMMMAAGFMAIGLLGTIAISRGGSTEPLSPDASTTSDQDETMDEGASMMSANDRELFLSALTNAAPLAVPALMQTVVRNLPLLLAIAAAAFVLLRPESDPAATSTPEPAAE